MQSIADARIEPSFYRAGASPARPSADRSMVAKYLLVLLANMSCAALAAAMDETLDNDGTWIARIDGARLRLGDFFYSWSLPASARSYARVLPG